MDRRLWPATDRVAHVSLRGQAACDTWTDGEVLRVQVPIVDLQRSQSGARERQLLLGEAFTVIDRDAGHVFGFAVKDGYCGWLPAAALAQAPSPSHWIATVGTHRYTEPKVQKPEQPLPMGAQVRVTGQTGTFAHVDGGYVPASHLRRMGDWLTDPVSVAEGLLGTPYLWGGNSRAGIDCSGLVQASFAACGIAMPGDSDLQQVVGADVGDDLKRGDLVFWKGHVAMVVSADRLIHANGFTMSVAYEGIRACIDRIAASDGPVTARRRVS